MKPYAIAAMSRRRVASICPPQVVSHYCRRLDLHSDCREIRGPRGVPDPRPARGRRPRGADPGRRPKPRALLAALLLAPGTVLSTDRLVAAVWGGTRRGTPSARCGPTCRGCARCSRNGCGGGRRATRSTSPTASSTPPSSGASPGSPAERAAAGDHAAAVDLLDTALGLWRGEPLDEFDPADIDRDGQLDRAWPTCASPPSRSGAALLRLGAGRGSSPSWRRWSSTHPHRERPPPCSMHAPLRGRPAGRRAGRLPGPAPASSTSWASSRPSRPRVAPPGAGAGPDARAPDPAPARRTQPAAPRHRASSAATGGSTRSRARCGRPAGHARRRRGRREDPARRRGGGPRARPVRRRCVAHRAGPAGRRRLRRARRRGAPWACSSGTAGRSSRRSSSTSPPARSCSCWTTASTCWTPPPRLAQRLVAQLPRRRRCSPPAGSRSVWTASRCGRCRRCRSRTPRRCSCCGRGPPAPTSIPTSTRSPRSAGGSTACRSASSWPRPAPGR